MTTLTPDPEQAMAFAIMIDAGMPSLDALKYFVEETDDLTSATIRTIHDKWVRSREFKKAILQVQGKSWEKMSLDERIKNSVNKVYTEMAYYLHSHNYATLDGPARSKADTCREALERRLAGTAGKLSGLDEWYRDVLAKKVTLPPADQTGLKIVVPVSTQNGN